MRAVCSNFSAIRPRELAASRPRVPGPGGHVIGVEEICKPLIEDSISREMRTEQELLEKPCRMRAVPFCGARIGHRLHHLILGAKWRGPALGLRAHGTKGL